MPHDGPSPLAPSFNGGQDGRFTLGNFAIDEYKPIKVIVIGAGFSGILAAIRCVVRIEDSVGRDILNGEFRFPQKIPNVQLSVYEKSDGIGGTWYNNKYPCVYLLPVLRTHAYLVESKGRCMRYPGALRTL